MYALAVLLYELLTGTTPLDGDRLRGATLSEIQRLIVHEGRVRPSVRMAEAARKSISVTGPRTDPAARTTAASQGKSGADEVACLRRTDLPNLVLTLRGDLDWIVMRCLERDRRHRSDTVAALADDIGR